MSQQRTYGYTELAARIEEVLGKRPALSTLRAAHAKADQKITTPPRLTAGMPAPLPASSPTSPAQFSGPAIEAWLAQHPRVRWEAACKVLREALSREHPPDAAVATARAAGLSWRTITKLMTDYDGLPHTVAGVHKRFRTR